MLFGDDLIKLELLTAQHHKYDQPKFCKISKLLYIIAGFYLPGNAVGQHCMVGWLVEASLCFQFEYGTVQCSLLQLDFKGGLLHFCLASKRDGTLRDFAYSRIKLEILT